MSICKALSALGARSENIKSLKRFGLALTDLKERQPEIIICEYAIESKYSLDLQKIQKQIYPKTSDRFFMLITSNSSESVVAEAAEEDVDSFLLKPFANNQLLKYLVSGFMSKIRPSDYQQLIEKGKENLANKKFDEAYENFKSALQHSDKPCLAHYYLAKVVEEQKNYIKAINEYQLGLNINPIHYKCLVGKFEAYDAIKDIDKAYEVIQMVVCKFPISPQRLAKIFKLAVYTRNFQDIYKYYEVYNKLERKSDELNKVVPAGLLVYSKYLLKKGDYEKAVNALQKTVLASQLDPVYLERVIETLLNYKRHEDAERILMQFPQHQREDDLYKYLNFKVSTYISNDNEIINNGRKLVREGIKYPYVYEVVTERLFLNEKNNIAETIAYKAIELFPDKRDFFVNLLEKYENT